MIFRLLLLLLSVCGLFVSISASPDDGPCRILNNGMKCTAAGYFELVQCDAKSCFCVQANNGEIAYETRTTNKQTAPTCSVCYNSLKQAYAHGQPPSDNYIPLCDNRKGDFQHVQCTADRRTCFCVNPETGKEIPGTKKKVTGFEAMVCGGTAQQHSVNGTFPSAKGQTVYPVGKESCKLDKDRGQRCAKYNPTIQYYFDVSTFECLAFEYLGCSGNDNRYPTRSACAGECKLPDLSGCSGMDPPAVGRDGQTINCGASVLAGFSPPQNPQIRPTSQPVGQPKNPDSECPSGYRCVMGAFFGSCCRIENEDLYSANYHPRCANRRSPVRERNSEWQQTLIGKSCSDNFCPRGTTCEQKEIFAHCC